MTSCCPTCRVCLFHEYQSVPASPRRYAALSSAKHLGPVPVSPVLSAPESRNEPVRRATFERRIGLSICIRSILPAYRESLGPRSCSSLFQSLPMLVWNREHVKRCCPHSMFCTHSPAPRRSDVLQSRQYLDRECAMRYPDTRTLGLCLRYRSDRHSSLPLRSLGICVRWPEPQTQACSPMHQCPYPNTATPPNLAQKQISPYAKGLV